MKARLAFTLALLLGSLAHAEPKLEDVFRSTQENFGQKTDTGMLMAIVCAAGGIIILLVLLHRRMQRTALPKVLNHHGKLLRELHKKINLKPADVRQLKTLAESHSLENPLTLLLCPSLIAKTVRDQPEKIDRKALGSLLKRVGD